MANWCSNRLTLDGPTKAIQKFLATAKSWDEERDEENPFDFNALVPFPEELAELDSLTRYLREKGYTEKYNEIQYNWRIDNWGSKWTANDVFINDNCIEFDTPWSPPIPLIVTVAKKFPAIEFCLEYWEPGMDFQGMLRVKGDEILEEVNEAYQPREGDEVEEDD